MEFPKDIMESNRLVNVYAVTGVEHGSIVESPTKGLAAKAFNKAYPKELIIDIKDISDYNLENL